MFGMIWSGLKAVVGLGSHDGFDKVSKMASSVGGFIDEQSFTEEEKAKHNIAIAESMQKFVAATAGENTIRSQTRRHMALAVMATFLFWFSAQIILHLCGLESSAEFVREQITTSPFAPLVGGVGAFFFATHLVRSVK